MPTKKIDWEKVREERRGKILWLDENQMLDFIVTTQEKTRVTRIVLPDNCRVLTAYPSHSRQAFGFIIISPDFEPNPEGVSLPDTYMGRIGAEIIEVGVPPKNEG